MDLPPGQSDVFFRNYELTDTLSSRRERCLRKKIGEEGYGRISGGTRVLEMAADNKEAELGHGAR
jgi:hypothetical protein